jgi:hypothetical protein
MLNRPIVYFQVTAGAITAELVSDGSTVTLACSALTHPRTLMGEFTSVQTTMKEALVRLGLCSWFKRAPITLTHLIPQVEGGYTNVELRAFREAALGAGSAQAYLLADHAPLSTSEKLEIKQVFGRSLL